MKLTACIIGLLTCFFVTAQELVPGAYYWDKSTVTKTKTGSTKKIFSGSGIPLSQHTMNGIIISKGKTIKYAPSATDNELFFIVKSGPVSVTLLDKKYTIDRGSVILLLPGDQLSIENTGDKDAELYEMGSRSVAAPDPERGKNAGPSFVMNWNDMVFKPTDKGGVRQLFDRKTTMMGRFDIHVTQLNEGFNSHPPHTHKLEEIILMLDGNAEMTVGTDHQKANAGDVVWMGSMVSHNLTNVGKTPCLYFAIQWN